MGVKHSISQKKSELKINYEEIEVNVTENKFDICDSKGSLSIKDDNVKMLTKESDIFTGRGVLDINSAPADNSIPHSRLVIGVIPTVNNENENGNESPFLSISNDKRKHVVFGSQYCFNNECVTMPHECRNALFVDNTFSCDNILLKKFDSN